MAQKVIPEPPHAEPILPTLPLPPPSTRGVTPSVVQRKDEGAVASSILLPSGIPVPSLASAGDSAPAQGLSQHGTALQEELSVQLAQMACQLRRNAEHFSTALAADQAVLRSTEEKIGENYDVMKRERVRLRDHRGRSLGTTCLTITSVLVVAVAFLVMFFLLRFT